MTTGAHDAAANTDRELWREHEGDFYAPALFVTQNGGVGINVGGTVFVKPAREWHRLATLAEGWLIEHPDTTQSVRYLTLNHAVPSFWTSDHLLALRFARQQDAADFQNYFAPSAGEGGKIVEHCWED